MVIIKDIIEVSCNKMINDIQKSLIRRYCSPCVAENMCICIDVHEKFIISGILWVYIGG